MISIHFQGTATEVMAEMALLVAAHGVSPIDAAPAEPTPKASRSTKKADKPAPEKEPEGNASAGTATETAGSSASQTSALATAGETPSREEIAKKATAYGQPSKGGPAALKELFIQHGSAQGKWSEVPDESLPALNAQLDELLA